MITPEGFKEEIDVYSRAFHEWGLGIHAQYLRGELDPDAASEALGKIGFCASILGEHMLGLRDDVARREKEKVPKPAYIPPPPSYWGGGYGGIGY